MVKQTQALRNVDVPFYRYWQALIWSFFSRSLYVDVGKRWRGLAIGYLFILMLVVAIPFALRIILDFNYFFDEQITQPLQQLPPLYIQNGKISVDQPVPYYVKNKEGQVVAIIDTSGRIKTIDNTYPYLTTLITQDKLFYRMPSPHFFFSKTNESSYNTTIVQPLGKQVNQVFDGKQWVALSGVTRLKHLSQVMIYPIIALMFFVIYLGFLLVFALLGQLVARLLFKFSITYAQACRLLMVSVTPQVVVLVVILTFNWLFTGLDFLLLVLLSVYFSFAILSLKRESNKMVIG